MKFAEPMWLFGAAFALVVAGFYVWGGWRLLRGLDRFGERPLVEGLVTAKTGGMRALKGGLVVLAVALAFVALAGPQYGRGTRLIPATNLDCVIVLDYSKSMYARDVAPNRSERAKAEVARLIADLPGARFGAVAFAGEPLSFPLTSDSGATAQFFRQMQPNDMPIGGTAIARALESARELLQRDPLSKKHQKVIVLITDGEDLEGDPVEVAREANQEGTLVYVVQVGGRSPEVIPEVAEDGTVAGVRRGRDGRPLTTSLSADGEEQLAKVAKVGGGRVVRAEKGQTGIAEVAAQLKTMMTQELAEKVETVYADVFFYPLGLVLLLIVAETFVPLIRRRRAKSVAAAKATATSLIVGSLGLLGCDTVEQRLFSRHSPVVDNAVAALETNDAGTATSLLTTYLNTGQCEDGALGTPDSLRELPDATFDLGLALFQIAERYGDRFGEPLGATMGAPTGPTSGGPQGSPLAQAQLAKRSAEVDCALRIVRLIAADDDLPLSLRAQAYYLSGNLEFLRHEFQSAVDSYDRVLRLSPGGQGDGGTEVGTNAAFNRAIALRRIQEEEDNQEDPPPQDAGPPSDGGSGDEDSQDQDNQDQDSEDQDQDQDQEQDDQDSENQDQDDQSQDQENQDPEDQNPENQDEQDQPSDQDDPGQDESQQEEAANQPPPSPSAPPPSLGQDERMLDLLERAPMLQHQHDKRRGRARLRMEDK